MATIAARLEGRRGADYYREWRQIWQEIREEALAAAQFIAAETGQITPRALVEIADLYGAPFKTLVDQLEAEGVIPVGTHQRLYAEGFSLSRTREEIAQGREGPQAQAARRVGQLTPIALLLQKEMPL